MTMLGASGPNDAERDDDGFISVPRRRSRGGRSGPSPPIRAPKGEKGSSANGFVYASPRQSSSTPSSHEPIDDPLARAKKRDQRIVSIQGWIQELQSSEIGSVLHQVWPLPGRSAALSGETRLVQSAPPPLPVVPTRILALGLGSLVDSRSAQVQLALLVLLIRHFQSILDAATGTEAAAGSSSPSSPSSSSTVDNPASSSSSSSSSPPPTSTARASPPPKTVLAIAYDPIFTPLDGEILSAFDVHLDTADRGGRYDFSEPLCRDDPAEQPRPTLAYMPHCGRTLYDRLLRSNWSSRGLGTTSLLCNRLERYATHLPARTMERESAAVHRLVANLCAIPLPVFPNATVSEALNDLAIQYWNGAVRLPAAASPAPTGGRSTRPRGRKAGVARKPTLTGLERKVQSLSLDVDADGDGDGNGEGEGGADTVRQQRGGDERGAPSFWTLPPEVAVPLDGDGREVLH